MTLDGFIAANLPGRRETYHYRVTPRAKPLYRSVLDARSLFGGPDSRGARSVYEAWSETLAGQTKLMTRSVLHLDAGEIEERVRYGSRGGILITERFERDSRNRDGVQVREERIDFHQGPIHFPLDLYPEVYAPFLMRGEPAPPQRRAFHSWISDRMVARVYYELHRKRVSVLVPAGRFDCSEILMYPDLNDWIPLGNLITTLAKPLLPRYHFWLGLEAPHPVVRFEGAYGPPGAPEVVVELERME